MITLLITDGNLTPVGNIITGWSQLGVTVNANASASGSVIVPATPGILDAVNADRARLVVIRDGAVFCAGPIEAPNYDWQQTDGSGGGGSSDQSEPGLLTLSITDDLARIAAATTYANPAAASTGQTVGAVYSISSTNAESALYSLVSSQVGAGALTARKIAQLITATPAGVGSTISAKATAFQPLGDFLRAVALAGGGLGFGTTQVGKNIVFGVYQPADASGQVRFSRGLGNLREIHYAPSAPTCNVAIVVGASSIVERPDTASVSRWGRIEQIVDQSGETNSTILSQAGDQALADGGETAMVSFVGVDTVSQRFGRDYTLGDLVTVEVLPGLEIVQPVQAYTLTADPNTGEVGTPQIGTSTQITDPVLLRTLRGMERRLGRLERTH